MVWRLVDTAAITAVIEEQATALAMVIVEQASKTRRIIMATAAENQARIDNLTTQLGKVKNEVLTEIDALKAAAAAGQDLDFSGLDAAAQALDDLNPDAPAPEPTPEPEPVPGEGDGNGSDDSGSGDAPVTA